MGLPLGPLRRRSPESQDPPEPAREHGRARSAMRRARPVLRRALPTLILAVGVATPAVAVGALAMRAGDDDPAPAAAAPGPTGPSGTTGSVPVAPALGPTGTTGPPAVSAPRAGADYYRRTARRRVAASAEAGFVPLYREAARVFGVDWRLIASVHRQETAFSSEPSTYKGLNAFGCCGGPMQFNVTNGPVSTWDSYKQSFRQGTRPAAYPHPTRNHPSLYDDFDAIMAAGALLRDGGAGGSGLDGGAWLAAYTYYGRDEFGVTYASQVLARALAWRRDGFAINSAEDPALFARLEDTYGVFEREKLRAGSAEATEEADARKARQKASRERRAARRRKEAAAAAKADRATPPAPRPEQAAKQPKPASGAKPPSRPSTTKTSPTAPEPTGTSGATGAG